MANVDQLKMVGGNEILYSAKIIVAQNTTDPNNVYKPIKEDYLKDEDAFLAMIFLQRNDFHHYSTLLAGLHEDDIKGVGKYPVTLSAAFELLQNFEVSPNSRQRTPRKKWRQ